MRNTPMISTIQWPGMRCPAIPEPTALNAASSFGRPTRWSGNSGSAGPDSCANAEGGGCRRPFLAHREEQHLQEAVLRERVHDAVGDHVQQELRGRREVPAVSLGGDLGGVERRGVDVHPRRPAGPETVDMSADARSGK